MAVQALANFGEIAKGFTQYGKLIGKGKKSGVEVYEALFGNKRILTSVKDGKLFRQTVKETFNGEKCKLPQFIEKDQNVYITTTKDFVTGAESMHTRTADNAYRRFWKNEGENYISYSHKAHNISSHGAYGSGASVQRITHIDFGKQEVMKAEKNGTYIDLNSYKLTDAGKQNIPISDNISIPQDIYAYGQWSNGKIVVKPELVSCSHEKNLCASILDSISETFKKFGVGKQA